MKKFSRYYLVLVYEEIKNIFLFFNGVMRGINSMNCILNI